MFHGLMDLVFEVGLTPTPLDHELKKIMIGHIWMVQILFINNFFQSWVKHSLNHEPKKAMIGLQTFCHNIFSILKVSTKFVRDGPKEL